MTAARGLLVASHPGPSLVVTAVIVGLGVAAGLPSARLVLLAGAVAAGQASIGLANDWVDGRAGRDAGRADKPVAVGTVSVQAVRTAALLSLVVCAGLSLLLGVVPAAWHLLAVAGGWAYDWVLKSTVLSPLPYLVSFGLLPVVVAATAEASPSVGSDVAALVLGTPTAAVSGAPWWAIATAGLFGAGMHFANVLPDLDQDAATGVRGLPQRAGPRVAAVAAGLLLGSGAAVALTAESAMAGWTPWGSVVAATALVLVCLTLIQALRGSYAIAYRCAVAAGLLLVSALVANGTALA